MSESASRRSGRRDRSAGIEANSASMPARVAGVHRRCAGNGWSFTRSTPGSVCGPGSFSYLDLSAIVELAIREPESAALRRYLRGRRPLVSSALAHGSRARPPAVRSRGHRAWSRCPRSNRSCAVERPRAGRCRQAPPRRSPVVRRHPCGYRAGTGKRLGASRDLRRQDGGCGPGAGVHRVCAGLTQPRGFPGSAGGSTPSARQRLGRHPQRVLLDRSEDGAIRRGTRAAVSEGNSDKTEP